MCQIDDKFISEWAPKYDLTENDEAEYNVLIDIVSKDISANRSISKETFFRILDWKSSRTKGFIQSDLYDVRYMPIFRNCIDENDIVKKLELLTSLHGIGIPVASTVLHFIEPDRYPIIDKRTISALNHFRYNVSINGYLEYLDAIAIIRQKTSSSLRKIDRALFAYHKLELDSKSAKHCRKYLNTFPITERCINNQNNQTSKNDGINISQILDDLADMYIGDMNQRTIFKQPGVWQKVKLNYIGGYLLDRKGIHKFTPMQIRDILRKAIPSLEDISDSKLSGIVLTQDVHLDSKKEYSNGYPCLKKVDRGLYEFVGFQ